MNKINEAFKIYVDQLHDGRIEYIEEKFPADFLALKLEDELRFTGEVLMDGQTYLANDALVLRFSVTAHAVLPCSICNQPVDVEINIQDFYHMEPLAAIKSAVYCFENLLRETILLEAPAFVECNNGKCDNRNKMKKFLKTQGESSPDEEGHQPFAHLT